MDVDKQLMDAARGLGASVGMPGPWLVAVSGGVDSMVLLHVVHRVAALVGVVVSVAHIHHGLRSASDTEEEFVRQHCAQLGVACEVRRLELGTQGPAAGNEAALRDSRYRAISSIARDLGVSAVWLGHHADDQLETMLWRIARGTSPSGLAGIRPVVFREGLRWLRPFLPFSRETIRAYARKHGIDHVEDESNRDGRFTRNRIRMDVVPGLRAGHPKAAEHAARLAQVLQDEDEWMDEQARRVLESAAVTSSDGSRLAVHDFVKVPLPLQRRAIKILLYCLAPSDWTMRHIDAIVQLAHSESPSDRIQLPAGILARREYGDLWVEREVGNHSEDPPCTQWFLADGACLRGIHDGAGVWEFCCGTWPSASGMDPSPWRLYIADLQELMVRTASHGERFYPLGMAGSRKVQDVFTDAKVPKHIRWTWPIVADVDGNIVWIPGVARSRFRLVADDCARGWVVSAVRHLQDRTV